MQARAEGGPVEVPRLHVPAIGAGFFGDPGIFAGKDHQLLGHAAPDDAGAAVAVLFGQRHLDAALRRDTRRAHAARTAADDEQIIVEIAHQIPLP